MNIYVFSIINCFSSVFSALSVVQKIFYELIGLGIINDPFIFSGILCNFIDYIQNYTISESVIVSEKTQEPSPAYLDDSAFSCGNNRNQPGCAT